MTSDALCTRNDSPALELEFYVPNVVWDLPHTREFIANVSALVEGASVLGRVKGLWHGEVETTHIVRLLVKTREVDAHQLLSSIDAGIDRMMAAWAQDQRTRQQSFLYTSRELIVRETRLLDR